MSMLFMLAYQHYSCMYTYKIHLFCTSANTSFPSARVFPRALDCGARRGTRVYTGRNFGPPPGSEARALGVQSRGELVLSRGCFPPSQSQAVRWKSTQKKASSFFSRVLLCITCLLYTSDAADE